MLEYMCIFDKKCVMKVRNILLGCSLLTVYYGLAQVDDAVNKGVLHVNSNTDLVFKGNFHNDETGNLTTDGDIYFEGDFRNQNVFVATGGTVFLTGDGTQNLYDDYTQNPLKYYIFNNLEINNTGASGSEGVLVDNNVGIDVLSKLILRNGDLRLKGEAQLIQNAATDINEYYSGSLMRDRWGTSSTYAFNYYGSPVHSFVDAVDKPFYSLDEILYDGTDSDINPFSPQKVNFISGNNHDGMPGVVDPSGNVTTPVSINQGWLAAYFKGSGSVSEWIDIGPSQNMTPFLGFIMKGPGVSGQQQNYVFKGIPNNGVFSIPNVHTGEDYLIANPYPCALDSRSFISQNPSINEIQFWVDGGTLSHNQANYYGGMAIRNLVAGVAPSVIPGYGSGLGGSKDVRPGRYVALGQSFIVAAVADGTINIDNAQRSWTTEAHGDSEFHRTEAGAETTNFDDVSVIYFGHEDPEGFHRQLALAFVPNNPDVDAGVNPGFDTEMVLPREDELFFIINNDLTTKYVIQALGAFDESITVPVGLLIGENGQHSIELDGVDNFAHDVYIHDKVEDTYIHLSTTKFFYNAVVGEYLDRFEITFTNGTASIDENKLIDMQVFVNNSEELVVSTSPDVVVQGIEGYTTVGQKVLSAENDLGDPISFVQPSGVYIIRVQTNQGVRVFKVLKK